MHNEKKSYLFYQAITKQLQINNTDVCVSMLIKKMLLSNYSITTQILERNSLWPWKLWV